MKTLHFVQATSLLSNPVKIASSLGGMYVHPAGHVVDGAAIVPLTKSVAQSVGGSADGSVAKHSSTIRASVVAPLKRSTIASEVVVVSEGLES